MKLSGSRIQLTVILALGAFSFAQAGTVPAVVVESAAKMIPGYVAPATNCTFTPPATEPVYPSSFVNPGQVAVDSKGNIFVADFGGGSGKACYTGAGAFLWEIPAGSTTPIGIASGLGGNSVVAVDANNDVIFTNSYNGATFILKNTGGVLATTPVNISNIGGLDGYYAGFSAVAVVGSTVYAAVSHANNGNNTAIYSFTTTGTNGAVVLTALPGGKYATSMAADSNGHLYYTDGTGVYVIGLTAPVPAATQITGLALGTPGAVSTDAAGNLFITDKTNSRILEVPNEGGTLNTVDQFVVATGVYDSYAVGIDPLGNLYYTDVYNSNSLWKVTRGGAAFPTTAAGSASATTTINFIFNFPQPATPVTPAPSTTIGSIGYYQGTKASTEFPLSYGSCVTAVTALTAFTEGQSCNLVMSFKPAEAGMRTGSAVLQVAGKPIGTAYLSGIGNAAAITIDPGTQTTLTGTASPAISYKSPSATAFDASGNLYVADASLNAVFVTPAGASAATLQLGPGLGLSIPTGVSVDAAGNVFIVDSGNNRVVEVPNEAGVLNPADVVVVSATGLKNPTGVAAAPDGSLYITDTGNGRVLRLSTFNGVGSTVQKVVGSGFTAPQYVTTDAFGNVYVSDLGLGGNAGFIQLVTPISGAVSSLLTQLSQPGAVAVDAAGDVYYVNSGTQAALMVPNISGVLTPASRLALGSGIVTPTGLAVDALGNVAIADGGASTAYKLARTAGSVNFGNVNIQLSSTPQQATITSAGNLPLTLGTPYAAVTGSTANFQQQSPTNECGNAGTFATGTGCVVSVIFAPVAINALSETYTFTTNAVNSAAPTAVFAGFATNLSLTTTTLSMTPPSNVSFGQTVTVTASVTASRAGYTPTGTVQFFLDGSKSGVGTVVNGTANTASYAYSIAAGNQLSAGQHTICGSYSGDTANAASVAATCLIFTVAQVTPTVSLKVLPTWAVAPGSGLYFTVTVVPPVAFAPTGTFTLYAVAGGVSTPLTGATLIPLGSAGTTGTGQASVITVTVASAGLLGLGQYQIVAKYSGDSNFTTASSAAISVSVQNPSYTVSIPTTNITVKNGGSTSIPITITTLAGYGTLSDNGNFSNSTAASTGGYIPASGSVVASVTAELVDSLCSALPTNATCSFSPGVEIINSYNVNDKCQIVSPPAIPGGYGYCFYNPFTGGCVASLPTSPAGVTPALYAAGTVNYCSDPNFVNTYTLTLTVSAGVTPPTHAGLGGGRLWPLGALSLGLLGLLLRHRRRFRVVGNGLFAMLLIASLIVAPVGCGSGGNPYPSPTGSTPFNLTFIGQNPANLGTTGVGSNAGAGAITLTQFGVTNNVLSVQTAALSVPISTISPGNIALFNTMAYTTAVTTVPANSPPGTAGTTVTTTTSYPLLNTATIPTLAYVNPTITAVPLGAGATAAQFSVNLTTPNVPQVTAGTTTGLDAAGNTVTTVIKMTAAATVTVANLVQTFPMTLTITN